MYFSIDFFKGLFQGALLVLSYYCVTSCAKWFTLQFPGVINKRKTPILGDPHITSDTKFKTYISNYLTRLTANLSLPYITIPGKLSRLQLTRHVDINQMSTLSPQTEPVSHNFLSNINPMESPSSAAPGMVTETVHYFQRGTLVWVQNYKDKSKGKAIPWEQGNIESVRFFGQAFGKYETDFSKVSLGPPSYDVCLLRKDNAGYKIRLYVTNHQIRMTEPKPAIV